jgi:GNAT superfamily N-acetyltransferase
VSATKVDALGGKVYASARRERQHERMARTKRATYSTSQRTSTRMPTPSTDSSTYCGVAAVMASVVMTRTRRGRTARRRVPSLVRRHFHHARVPLRTPCRFATAATLEARASSTRCCHSDRDRRALLTATSGAPHASAGTGVHIRTVTYLQRVQGQAEVSLIIGPEFRRRGIGTAAVRALIDKGRELGLRSIVGECCGRSRAREFWLRQLRNWPCVTENVDSHDVGSFTWQWAIK